MSKDMSSVRHERLSRVMALLQSKSKATHEEIFAEGQYPSERTFQNDLRFLRDTYGAEISYDRANKVYVLAGAGSLTLNLTIVNEEAEALAAGLKLAAHFMPHLKQGADSLFDKISGLIPKDIASHGANIAKSVAAGVPYAEIDAVLFKKLLEAKYSKKAVRVSCAFPYQDRVSEECILSPYDIYFSRGAWRVVCYNHAKKALDTLNLSWINAVSTSREGYIAPEKVGLKKDNLANAAQGSEKSFIRLKVGAGEFADYLRNIKLKRGQKLEETQTGGVVLTAEVPYIEDLMKEVISGEN